MAQMTWNNKTIKTDVMNTENEMKTTRDIFNQAFNLDNQTMFFWKNPIECKVERDNIPCGKGSIVLTKDELQKIEESEFF